MPSSLIQVHWPDHPWLVHGFGTRSGHVANHAALDTSAPLDPGRRPLITLKQTHSAVVHRIPSQALGQIGSRGVPYAEGDGLITDQPGVLLGIQTADCVPILIADLHTRAVGAFHAGWRGTVAGIVGQGVQEMAANFGSDPIDLVAAIGPSIGPCCYRVGEEVRNAFTERFVDGQTLFHRNEVDSANPRLDLREANRRQLIAKGLPPEQISVVAQCTACTFDPDGQRRFFSYRAEAGVTGRMISVIGIRKE